MYRCDVCNSVTEPGTKLHRIAVETRPVEYPLRSAIHWHPPKAGGKGKWIDDPGGHGTMIVREIDACPPCAQTHAALRVSTA